jgi:uncharacterized caspase-like protein
LTATPDQQILIAGVKSLFPLPSARTAPVQRTSNGHHPFGSWPMFRTAFCSAILLGAALAGSSAAHAETRLALVIGESAYRAVPSLPNPANDARAMTKLLTDSGFQVTAASDLSQKELNQKIGDFTAEIAAHGPDTVALVFYAGHGLQIDGENYLVPVDVDPKREADIPLQAVRLNDVINTLNSVRTKSRIVLLDACRNNPFPALNGTVGRGLALVDTKTGAPGTFLSYSTSPGAEALDGEGADSPYTTALLTAARTPGLPIEQAFKQVRVAVNKATGGRQTPWESSSLTEDFRFTAAASPSDANAAVPPAAATNAPKRTVEEWKRSLQSKHADVAHEMIVADGTLEAYEAYDALFTQSQFAPEVREWVVRQRKMVAWNEAVTINTAASYRSFLAQYPDTDLSLTARMLIERLRFKPSPLPQVAALCTPPASSPATPTPTLKKADVAPAQTQTVIKKVAVDPPARQLPHREVYVDEPVYGGGMPMRPVYHPMGFGFGGGMMGRPMGGFGRR